MSSFDEALSMIAMADKGITLTPIERNSTECRERENAFREHLRSIPYEQINKCSSIGKIDYLCYKLCPYLDTDTLLGRIDEWMDNDMECFIVTHQRFINWDNYKLNEFELWMCGLLARPEECPMTAFYSRRSGAFTGYNLHMFKTLRDFKVEFFGPVNIKSRSAMDYVFEESLIDIPIERVEYIKKRIADNLEHANQANLSVFISKLAKTDLIIPEEIDSWSFSLKYAFNPTILSLCLDMQDSKRREELWNKYWSNPEDGCREILRELCNKE